MWTAPSKLDGSFIEQRAEDQYEMNTRQAWAGRIFLIVGSIAIIISIPGVGLPGILGVQEFPGKIVLAIATLILAVGALLIGVSAQERPV